jgi:starch phosphorylase
MSCGANWNRTLAGDTESMICIASRSRDRLERLLSHPSLRAKVEVLLEAKRKVEGSDAWFQKAHPSSPLHAVAYLSMEYMLGEALPIYSGGLGNVAGDPLRAASDLGIPIVAVGLLFQQGYFRQEIGSTGAQVALYPFSDPGQLPTRPLRTKAGDWLRLKISMPGHPLLWIRAWEARVGRRRLYLWIRTTQPICPAHRHKGAATTDR